MRSCIVPLHCSNARQATLLHPSYRVCIGSCLGRTGGLSVDTRLPAGGASGTRQDGARALGGGFAPPPWPPPCPGRLLPNAMLSRRACPAACTLGLRHVLKTGWGSELHGAVCVTGPFLTPDRTRGPCERHPSSARAAERVGRRWLPARGGHTLEPLDPSSLHRDPPALQPPPPWTLAGRRRPRARAAPVATSTCCRMAC